MTFLEDMEGTILIVFGFFCLEKKYTSLSPKEIILVCML